MGSVALSDPNVYENYTDLCPDSQVGTGRGGGRTVESQGQGLDRLWLTNLDASMSAWDSDAGSRHGVALTYHCGIDISLWQ